MITLLEQTWHVSHEDFREDLWWFQYAIDLGFVGKTECPVVSGLPTGPVSFVKGSLYIWQSTSWIWTARHLSKYSLGYESGANNYSSLKEALEQEILNIESR